MEMAKVELSDEWDRTHKVAGWLDDCLNAASCEEEQLIFAHCLLSYCDYLLSISLDMHGMHVFRIYVFMLLWRQGKVYDDTWRWLERITRKGDENVRGYVVVGVLLIIVEDEEWDVPGDWRDFYNMLRWTADPDLRDAVEWVYKEAYESSAKERLGEDLGRMKRDCVEKGLPFP